MKNFIEKICNEHAKNYNFSGVCMLKIKDKTIFHKAYGYANRSFNVKNNKDTRFDTASITKLFTAVAILQLVELGKLKLNDKVVDLIDLSESKIRKDVTIESLLNHTSGIADDAEEERGEDYSKLFINTPNYAVKECKDYLENFIYKEQNFKVGTNVRYCNCSYILLGLVIENLSRMNYRDYVKKNIFDKAGMENTFFSSMDNININTAEGYINLVDRNNNIIGYKKNIYSFPSIGSADSGAYTTTEDLTIFMDSLKEYKILSKEYVDILFSPHCQFTQSEEWHEIPGLYKRNGYAFEFFMFKDNNVPFCMFKDGINKGVATMFAYYPKDKITLVILSNQESNVWVMRKEIQKEILNRYY